MNGHITRKPEFFDKMSFNEILDELIDLVAEDTEFGCAHESIENARAALTRIHKLSVDAAYLAGAVGKVDYH